ncbi:hypothetical protein H4R35_007328, partial [Dimargaris xerosporica]
IKRFRDAHIQMVTRYIISPARRGKTGNPALQPRSTPASLDSIMPLTPPSSERPSPLTNSPISTATTIHDSVTPSGSDLNSDTYSAGQSSGRASLELTASTTSPPPLSPSDRTSSVLSFSSWRRFFTGTDGHATPVVPTPALTPPSLDGQSRPSSDWGGAQLFKVNQGLMNKQHHLLSTTPSTPGGSVPNEQAIVGSGGTSAIQFVKQVRDETKEALL